MRQPTGFSFSDGWFDRISPETLVIQANTDGETWPIAYIHKPKSLSAEDWTMVRAALRFAIGTAGLLLKGSDEGDELSGKSGELPAWVAGQVAP